MSDNEFSGNGSRALPFDKNFWSKILSSTCFPSGQLPGAAFTAVDRFLEQAQIYVRPQLCLAVFRDNFPFDSRGCVQLSPDRGKNTIMKYLYNYLGSDNQPISIFSKTGKWFLTRAATCTCIIQKQPTEPVKWTGLCTLGYTFDSIPGLVQGPPTHANIPAMVLACLMPQWWSARYRNPGTANAGIRGRAGLKPVVIDSVKYFNL